ncbi:hypothetical protein QAD02_003844 [Eretmocerus hayati]|uniref:Uncharacterized protein n=1 Tax=Eretmocerus hayati TaxID=131215 RepID=A0ACC2NSQ8_9HYME|nr:hypothetical protein QAD02_003844 [Eretmocerus hayati]
MAEESKKISFSFSKSIKKPALKNVPLPEEKKVDYIECIEDKTIKIVGGEEKEDEPLVIPMLGTKTWHDRIINKTDADIFEPKKLNPVKDEPLQDVQIKQEQLDGSLDSRNTNGIQPSNEVVIIKEEPIEEKHMTLDEQAAKEIIADLQSNKGQNTEQKVFSVPVAEEDLRGKEESTLEDYENIPIDQFGMAMLRGMGWQPGKGIGKNQKIVPPVLPELRPKGMGLGADKLISQKTQSKTVKQEEQLKLIQGAYVKVVAGKHDGKYGQIEGFDEDAARLIVKLAIGGNSINVNEVWVEPVTSSEYSQKSKVLNHFPNYAEVVPLGETSFALSKAAKENELFVIGGSIPEKDGDKLFNTCTVWNTSGQLIAKHRKMHLFDIDIKGKMTFRESDTLSAGEQLTTFNIGPWLVGVGICYDIRFEEMARLYRNMGCQLLVYPAAFNMTTGPMHWSLLQRSRANDCQVYVACVSPARIEGSGYIAYGHTQLTDPWAKVLKELDAQEDVIVHDIDLNTVEEVRAQIPISYQRRTDLYETTWKKN